MGRGKRTPASSGSARTTPAALPERFSVEPHYKQARVWHPSNPTGKVKDGYLVIDTLTGAVKRVDLKKQTQLEIERVLEREAALDWSQLASWSASFDRHPTTTLMEVHGHDARGERLGTIALVGRSHDAQETRQNVLRWLQEQGHPDLPELVR